jgi:hypothetical protein
MTKEQRREYDKEYARTHPRDRREYYRKYSKEHREQRNRNYRNFIKRHPGYFTKRSALWKKRHPEWKRNPEWIESYRPRKREIDRRYHRARRARLIGYKAKESAKYRTKNYRKYHAQQILNYAIKAGKIKRSVCEVCGAVKTHGHHDNYSFPLRVRWLCPVHHNQAHKK